MIPRLVGSEIVFSRVVAEREPSGIRAYLRLIFANIFVDNELMGLEAVTMVSRPRYVWCVQAVGARAAATILISLAPAEDLRAAAGRLAPYCRSAKTSTTSERSLESNARRVATPRHAAA
jgi:hypothetical protein